MSRIKFKSSYQRLFGILLLLGSFVMQVTVAYGQNSVTGVVTNSSGSAIYGVTVLVKNSKVGTFTDENGKFSIDAKKGDALVFSFSGFKTVEVAVGDQNEIAVQMNESSESLDDVVVIGYGVQKRSNLTGSISKVKNKGLDQIPIARVDDALVGQVAGINIQQTNPSAGEAPNIRIRGQGSISFESFPLIVVDGIAVGSDADYLASIDMNDVESVEVLKDAASSAIYGSRGANGIIMITTKKGVEGPTKFSYNSFVGIKRVPKRDNVVPRLDDWLANNANNLESSDRYQYVSLLGEETKWDEVMFDGGMINSHSLAASGGTKNTKFRASLSYLNDEGVLLTDNYEKLNFRLNLDTRVSERVSFGVVLNPSHTEQRRFPIGVHDALRQHAWLPLYITEENIKYVNRFRENGRFADVKVGDYAMERMFDDFDLSAGQPDPNSAGTDLSGTSNQSALAKVLERDYRKYQTKIFTTAYLKVDITDNLFFKQNIGGDMKFTKNENWAGVLSSRNGAGGTSSSRATSDQVHAVSESTLNFNKTIKKVHSVSAVGGFAFESWNRNRSEIEANGFSNDLIQTIPASNVTAAVATKSKEALVSALSRVNYSYDDKYLLSLSARWDGSSKFGPDNKFAFFPAVSLGWNMAREDFMKSFAFVSEFKLRGSYGLSGSNAGIGEYDYIGLIQPVGTALDGSNIGYNPINISNSALGWEKLKETNFGFELGLYKNRFGISFDIYNRTSSDLLLNLPVPSVTGFNSALVNKGVVENNGFELELIARPIQSRRINWTTSALFTRNENTLVDFAGASGLLSSVDDKRPANWIAQEGNPISSFYGYVISGEQIDPSYLAESAWPIGGQSQDIYVKDLNGDGVIDTDDQTILGDPYPDLIWSWNNTITFANFDFTMMWQGSHGAQVRNISSQYINNEFSGRQDYTSDFPDADKVVQRIFTNDDIQDAEYIALRNLNVGYTFGRSMLNKAKISGLRVYIAAQNLVYLMSDGYTGYNPEGVDLNNDAERNPLTYGYQRRTAPIYRTFSLGVNLNF